ncbi:hypothetical protein [Shewanella sp.]|uniref:hypothetical protein n=1 Tax=Shewanella sp. TaxID=50422 RepID=UPI003A8382C8
MKILLIIIVLGLTACASKTDEPSTDDYQTFSGLKNGELIYQGPITKASNEALFEAYEKSDKSPQKLVVSSPGGNISLGMELGKWIKDHNLDVEVSNICASSCANYVLTAANRKYLRKDSILIWHGSAWQEKWHNDKLNQVNLSNYLASMRDKETELFERFKVDNLLTVYGQSKLTLWDRILFLFGRNKVGWDYSIEDMNRFGLSNIVLIDKEWDWRKYRHNQRELVKRVKVDSEYYFKLHRFEM